MLHMSASGDNFSRFRDLHQKNKRKHSEEADDGSDEDFCIDDMVEMEEEDEYSEGGARVIASTTCVHTALHDYICSKLGIPKKELNQFQFSEQEHERIRTNGEARKHIITLRLIKRFKAERGDEESD